LKVWADRPQSRLANFSNDAPSSNKVDEILRKAHRAQSPP
jgi:hypothetical protein